MDLIRLALCPWQLFGVEFLVYFQLWIIGIGDQVNGETELNLLTTPIKQSEEWDCSELFFCLLKPLNDILSYNHEVPISSLEKKSLKGTLSMQWKKKKYFPNVYSNQPTESHLQFLAYTSFTLWVS